MGHLIAAVFLVVSLGWAPPRTITRNVELELVTCSLGYCCGSASVWYREHLYGGQYCRWFRPLSEGQVVSMTLRLDR